MEDGFYLDVPTNKSSRPFLSAGCRLELGGCQDSYAWLVVLVLAGIEMGIAPVSACHRARIDQVA